MLTCRFCELPFDTGRITKARTYCSKRCRESERNKKLKDSRQFLMTCKVCNAQVHTARQNQRFCSLGCRETFRKDNYQYLPKTQPKVLTCGWCEQDVVVPANFLSNRKYHDQCKVRAKRARHRIKTVKRQARTVKPSRLSADDLVDKMGNLCRICGDEIDMSLKRTSRMGLTVDHIIPLSKGGQDTLENMQPAHWVCNVRKGNKTNA